MTNGKDSRYALMTSAEETGWPHIFSFEGLSLTMYVKAARGSLEVQSSAAGQSRYVEAVGRMEWCRGRWLKRTFQHGKQV